MPKRYSSEDVAWLLSELGILFARHSKEDVFQGTKVKSAPLQDRDYGV